MGTYVRDGNVCIGCSLLPLFPKECGWCNNLKSRVNIIIEACVPTPAAQPGNPDDCGNCLHKMLCKFNPAANDLLKKSPCWHYHNCYQMPGAAQPGMEARLADIMREHYGWPDTGVQDLMKRLWHPKP